MTREYIDYLAEISHSKSLKRVVNPRGSEDLMNGCSLARVRHIFFKWTVHQYPGYQPILCEVLGVKKSGLRKMASGYQSLSRAGRSRLLAWLRTRQAEIVSLIADLEKEQADFDSYLHGNPMSNAAIRMRKAREAKALKAGKPVMDRQAKP